MPLRRKTRSSGKTDDHDHDQTSPTSNGGRTHPKEMYAPDRATRSRTSSEDLIILELPKSSRSLKKTTNQTKGGKLSNDAKSKKLDKTGDRLNSSSNSKQVNNVNNSGGTSSHANDGSPQVSNRARRQSGRLGSGDSVEKETPKKTSPQTAAEQSAARSERRRRRSGTDEQDSSVDVADSKNAKTDGVRQQRRRSSNDEKSPVGKSDTGRETKKGSATSKKPEPDPPDGNFKVPSIANKSKSSEPLDNTLLESPRSSRRHGSGKSAAIDTVLSVDVDVDVTSNDSLSTRTSPRRPKVSPRIADKKSAKEGEKASPTINNAAPVSPRTRSAAAKSDNQEVDVKSSASDSSRKRRPSGNQAVEVDGTHSSRKRKRTGSVCRDLTSQFDDRKSENGESSKTDNNNIEDIDGDESVADKSEQEGKDNSGNLLTDLQSLQDDNGISPSAKTGRKGTSTPTNSPRKSRSKSPGRSPSRRGLRSSGQTPAIASELIETEDSKQENNSAPKESSAESVDTSGVEDESTPQQRTEDTNEDRTEDTSVERTEDSKEDRTEEDQGELVQVEDYKPDFGELEDFHGDDWYEDIEDTELFFFESDHVALKGNRE